MYVLSELPSDLNKQGSPTIPPPAWFGPGITWDLPVKAEGKAKTLGRLSIGGIDVGKAILWVGGGASISAVIGYMVGGNKGALTGAAIGGALVVGVPFLLDKLFSPTGDWGEALATQ